MSRPRRASESTGYTGYTGQYSESSGQSSYYGGGTYADQSFRSGSGQTYADQSFRSASGHTYADQSFRSGSGQTYTNDGSGQSYYSGQEYYDEYGDEGSVYSSGSYSQQSRVSDSQKSGITSRQNLSRANNSVARRDQDTMSLNSMSSRTSQLRDSGNSSAFQSDAYSVAYSMGAVSMGATTVADGGRGRCPYQIEFSVSNTGKQMSTSKRIIHFRFGFADPKALMSGRAGVDCRGEEHDVVATWSITGGKRSLSVDGKEIHFEAGKRGQAATNPSRRADVFEAAWQMPEEHVCKLMCNAYKPSMGSPEKKNKKWRQYNLTIDGRSFFDLPQIFDLGLKGLGPRRVVESLPPVVIEATELVIPQNKQRDERHLKNDVQNRIEAQRSLLDSRKKAQAVRTRRAAHSDDVSVASVSTIGSANTAHSGYTVGSNLIDLTENLNMSDRTVYCNGPAELEEAKRRQAEELLRGMHEERAKAQNLPTVSQKMPPPQTQRAALPAPPKVPPPQTQRAALPAPQRQGNQNPYQIPPQCAAGSTDLLVPRYQPQQVSQQPMLSQNGATQPNNTPHMMAPRQQQSVSQNSQPAQPGNASNTLVPMQQPMPSQPSNIPQAMAQRQQPLSQSSIPLQPGNNYTMAPRQQIMAQNSAHGAMVTEQGQAGIQQQQYPPSQHLVIANHNVIQPSSVRNNMLARPSQQPPMMNNGGPNTMVLHQPSTQQQQLVPGANRMQQAPMQVAPVPKSSQQVVPVIPTPSQQNNPSNGLMCPQPPTMDDIRNSMSSTSQKSNNSNKFGFY